MSNFLLTRISSVAELLLCVLLCLGTTSASANNNWDRDVKLGAMADYPGVSLVILLTSSIGDHLSASCGYRYRERVGSVELHGKFDSGGEFWPAVNYEVRTGVDKWHRFAQATGSSDSAGIKIDSSHRFAKLKIDMDPFRPMIGKYRWGRIALENDVTALISLDDLLPTGNSPENRDYKTSVEDRNRFGSSFALFSVTCLSQHLSGDFGFLGREHESLVELAGTRDALGNFVPSVTWQAGNSDNDWQTLRDSNAMKDDVTERISTQNPDHMVRVDLDVYKAVIERFKYGKVIFSNGEFSVFELDKLRPPFMKPPPAPD